MYVYSTVSSSDCEAAKIKRTKTKMERGWVTGPGGGLIFWVGGFPLWGSFDMFLTCFGPFC